MKILGHPGTRTTRVLWAAEEAAAEYEFVRVDLMRGEARQPEFLQINPGGKVPVLVDGDVTLTESAAICTYIGDRFPDSGLVPEPGSPERAAYYQWCFFVIGELEQPLWTLAKHSYALPKARRVPRVKETAAWEFQVAATVLAQGLSDHEFIVNNRFTAADILIAHTLSWSQAAKLSLEHDNLRAYRARMLERPALARVRQAERGS